MYLNNFCIFVKTKHVKHFNHATTQVLCTAPLSTKLEFFAYKVHPRDRAALGGEKLQQVSDNIFNH